LALSLQYLFTVLFINNSNIVPFFCKIFVLKQFLLFATIVFLFHTNAFTQAPVIAYTPATNYVPVGTPFTITPANGGGAVPATIYGQVTTVAGTGSSGYKNAVGTAAQFNTPEAITGDASGNLYVADDHNNAIRMIAPDGTVTTVAGSLTGAQGDVNGTGTAALFYHPDGITMDASGNLFVSDGRNNKIKKITLPAGVVTTFATLTSTSGPAGLRFDGSGNLIVAQQGTSQIIQITPGGTVTTIAGSGGSGSADGTGTAAQFNFPSDLTLDGSGNIFVADYLNNEIRKIASGGITTTFAGSTAAGYADAIGTAAKFNNPTGAALGSGSIIYVADFVNNDIRKILPDGTVSLVAGSPTQASGATNGTGTAALFNQPDALYIDASGTGYVTEYINCTVRKVILTGYTIDKPLPAGLSFDQTTGTISGTLIAPVTGTSYTVTAYNPYGYSTTIVTLSSYNNWIGGTTDWATAGNWSQNQVPTTSDIAQIGVVSYTGTAQPDLSASTTVGSIIFGSNNSPALTINAGQTLTVASGITVNSTSSSTINGPGIISLGGASVINPTASLTASLNAVIVLAPASTLTNNGTFTLSSDANGSSSIAAIPTGASIKGTVNVQRYITGNNSNTYRGYRLLSSPVYTAIINSINCISLAYLNATVNGVNGAFTGGPGSGFSITNGNPTVYLYNESIPVSNAYFVSGKHVGIYAITGNTVSTVSNATGPVVITTGVPIPVGNGYLLYFTGSNARTNGSTSITPDNTILTASGSLNQGDLPVTLWYAPTGGTTGPQLSYTPSLPGPGFNMMGNPYACTIDLNQVLLHNSGIDAIYTLSPIGPTQAYAVFTQSGNSSPSPAYAVSGEGFIVHATAAAQSLTFHENEKASTIQLTGPQLLLGKPINEPALTGLYMKLEQDSIHHSYCGIYFRGDWSDKFEPGDAIDVNDNGFQLDVSSLSADGIHAAVNHMPDYIKGSRIRLYANAPAGGAYTLKIEGIRNIDTLYDIWLVDHYKNDSLNIRRLGSYAFNIVKSDTASYGNNRFVLAIRPNPAYAYQLLDFTAQRIAHSPQVELDWKTRNILIYTNFTVERSNDGGKSFTVVGGLPGTGGSDNYSLTDQNPLYGQNLYRLKQEDMAGTITYSKLVEVMFTGNDNADKIQIYPNPAINLINLNVVDKTAGNTSYDILVTNSSGLIVKQATSAQLNWQANVADLLPGTYLIRVMNTKDKSLVGQSKFVKL
jgi:sugar lactone lactonase YvrE